MDPATLISLLSGRLDAVSSEHIILRVRRLVLEACEVGQFEDEKRVMEAAGLSPSYLAQRVHDLKKSGKADMGFRALVGIAHALGISVATLIGEEPDPKLVDVHAGRAIAVEAARSFRFPDAAIQLVLRDDRPDDPGPVYWFRRIEAETERLRPVSSREPR
jgi:transcriptional regulator with XRE-family HTH domain